MNSRPWSTTRSCRAAMAKIAYDGTDFWERMEKAFLFGTPMRKEKPTLSPHIQIPCGRTTGMGESCSHGHLCGSCTYILELEERTKK